MVNSKSLTAILLGLVWLAMIGLPQNNEKGKASGTKAKPHPTSNNSKKNDTKAGASPAATVGRTTNRQTATPHISPTASASPNEIHVTVPDNAGDEEPKLPPPNANKNPPSKAPEGGFFSFVSFSTLMWCAAILGSFLVSGSISLLAWWKTKNLERALLLSRREIESKNHFWDTQIETLKEDVNNCRTAMNSLRGYIPPDLTEEIHNLKLQLQSLRSPRSTEAPVNSNASNSAPTVPTVRYYLNQVGSSVVRAGTAFMRGNTLTEDGDGKFALLPLRQNGQYFAIPYYERFGSAQDFSHYQKFYNCDQPSAGEIIVLDPAIVDFDASSREWNLRKKGILQINS